jgi:hypothetical protein
MYYASLSKIKGHIKVYHMCPGLRNVCQDDPMYYVAKKSREFAIKLMVLLQWCLKFIHTFLTEKRKEKRKEKRNF